MVNAILREDETSVFYCERETLDFFNCDTGTSKCIIKMLAQDVQTRGRQDKQTGILGLS